MLEPWQEAQVAGAIMLLPPSTVSERYTRWTKKAIAAYVERSFGVPFNAWQVDSHLRRWGFDSHKEVRRAFMHPPARDRLPHWSCGRRCDTAAGTLTNGNHGAFGTPPSRESHASRSGRQPPNR